MSKKIQHLKILIRNFNNAMRPKKRHQAKARTKAGATNIVKLPSQSLGDLGQQYIRQIASLTRFSIFGVYWQINTVHSMDKSFDDDGNDVVMANQYKTEVQVRNDKGKASLQVTGNLGTS